MTARPTPQSLADEIQAGLRGAELDHQDYVAIDFDEARELLVILAEISRLRAALSEAINEFEDASQYKGEYLAWKHGDAETVARLRAALEGGTK